MATQLQFRRGTTSQHAGFTGGVAEVTVDTTKNVVVVHDGVTPGGWPAPSLSFAQAAYDQANAAGSSTTVTAAFNQANTANVTAQSAFNKANTAEGTGQAAFDVANTKYSSSGGTISGNVVVTGNVTPTTDNVYSLGTASYRWKDIYVGPGSLYIGGIVLSNTNGSLTITGASDVSVPGSGAPSTTTVSETANLAFDKANAAFDTANTKFDTAGGTITGSVTITQELNVSGNLHVSGNVTTYDVNNVSLANGIIYLADGNSGNTIDVGIVGAFTEGIYQHTGVVRDNADGLWKFFSNVASEPTTTVDFTNAIYDTIKVGGIISPTATVNGIELGGYSTAAFSQANTAATLAQNAYNAANNAGTAVTDDTSTNSDYYPVFATATSGIPSFKVSSTKLLFNPSTGLLTAVDVNTSSDVNFKENIQPISSALNTVKALEGVSFNWKETGAKSYGVIAQELQKLLPELVHQSEHGLSVSYLPLIAILIEAVKEQQKQIDELKKQ